LFGGGRSKCNCVQKACPIFIIGWKWSRVSTSLELKAGSGLQLRFAFGIRRLRSACDFTIGPQAKSRPSRRKGAEGVPDPVRNELNLISCAFIICVSISSRGQERRSKISSSSHHRSSRMDGLYMLYNIKVVSVFQRAKARAFVLSSFIAIHFLDTFPE
jgi:hypothetical protein